MKIRVPEGLELRGEFQPTGVRHLMDGRRKLLLDDMGLGKTAQTIVAFSSLGAKSVLIHCPPAVRYSWAEEIKRWSVHNYTIDIVVGTMHKVNPKANIVICPYNLLDSPFVLDQIRSRSFGVGVADEIHFLKNGKSNRTEHVLKKKGTFTKCRYVWGLSGSIMPNRPIELYYIFHSMGKKFIPKKYQGYWNFTRRYCSRFRDLRGWNVSGASNLEELSSALFDSGFALRRMKADVLKDLPSCTERILPVIHGNVGAKEMGRVDLSCSNLGLAAGEISELRRLTALEKQKPCLDYVSEKLMSHEKVLVFCWTREIVQEAMKYLKVYNPVDYYGATTPARKEANKKKFMEDPDCRVMVANISSAGTGLDGLQKACSYAVFIEIAWTPAEINQAIARLHRMGQAYPVMADLLVAKGGIEEYILKRVFEKKDNIDILLRD